MKPGVEARVRASELVGRVDREGAWSNVVAREIDMPEADAALVRHLLYGTLRNRDRIDRAIAALSSRPLGAIQVDVRDVLRVAFHEVLFGRAADHAVADTAVESVPRAIATQGRRIRQRSSTESAAAGRTGASRWAWAVLRPSGMVGA